MEQIDLVLRSFGWPAFVWMVLTAVLTGAWLIHGMATSRLSVRLGFILAWLVIGGYVSVAILAALGIF